MTAKIRVLVVDDSAFARKVVRDVLEQSKEVEIVGWARDGLEALEMVAELKPDVVTLDLLMPNLDGLGVLRALPSTDGPRVVVVSVTPEDSDMAVEALTLGAIELVRKPTALATDRLYDVSAPLLVAVRTAAAARRRALAAVPPPVLPVEIRARQTRLVVIGASTGGPHALTRLVAALPAGLPVPVAIALHIPPGYTPALAARLHDICALDVVEASDGIELRPGLVVIAPGGMHLKIEAAGDAFVGRLDLSPLACAHHPSVDVLFQTAAQAAGDAVLGVVLTGMGDDGLEGARAMHAVGGRVLTESESSCVIYGMPRCVHEAGLDVAQVPIERMIEAIVERL
jgi:two-component system chemotaxis response regulator CheB